MLGKKIAERVDFAAVLLAVPLISIQVWLLASNSGYPRSWWAFGTVAGVVLSLLVLLIARWRIFGPLSCPVAGTLYVLAALASIAEAVSFYFQASSFNLRFFANVRLGNLRSGLDAFPILFVACALLLVGILAVAVWILFRQSRPWVTRHSLHPVFRWVSLGVLLAILVCSPSAGSRLFRFFHDYRQSESLLATAGGRAVAGMIDPEPVRKDKLRAWPGKNLVIVYMESLERIYTDDKIFPGLTPSLNRYRAQGLDYSGYLTFAGASYTMAGLFASQCGAPFFTSPWKAFDFSSGNDPNETTFQPELVCLGDVLHAAGYRQVFMNGSPLSFADQGNFFRLHGFDKVFGLDELEDMNGHKLAESGWGLYDNELFASAEARFNKLASSGKPFNLDVLTIDNHPPHGRPSPGCPKYAGSDNDVLQAVHCTDFLVGRFLDDISKNPAWTKTVVVVMSDHQSMHNDAWPLYPKDYTRRPLLFVINAGEGERPMRFYHMDIAPTVLHLMGVLTNASFIAGADRSAADAPGSRLTNDPTSWAVLRHALWAQAQPIELCRDGTLVSATDDGFDVSGQKVPLATHGERLFSLRSDQDLALFIGRRNIVSEVSSAGELAPLLSGRKDKRVLLILPDLNAPPSRRFSVDWIGSGGGYLHVADVPRLQELRIGGPDCGALTSQADELKSGQRLDASKQFQVRTAPLYPALPPDGAIDFASAGSRMFERDLGWWRPSSIGSLTAGDAASLGFTLPPDRCRAALATFEMRPWLKPSRPQLDVRVLANGKEVARWHFDGDETELRSMAAKIAGDAQCRVYLRFLFSRPGAQPPPYPAGEDPRPLQLRLRRVSVLPVPRAPQIQARVSAVPR